MEEQIVKKIAQEYGTPTYVFDIPKVNDRIKYLKTLLPKNVLLCYAIKANTFIVKDIEENIDRFEVCSPGEYEICKSKNVNSEKILISGVYKSEETTKYMLETDKKIGYYSIESMEQFELLKSLSRDRKINVMIRLTSGNQFGINECEVEEIIKNRSEYQNLDIKGIQYFAGTQRGSLKLLEKELNYMDTIIKRLEEQYNFTVQELEFGPGFPIHYFQNDEFNEKEFIEGFAEIIKNMNFKCKIILELGRSIAASCGYYITKVVDRKINKNQKYAILDGGINQLVYYGQSMAMKLPKCKVYPKRDNLDEEKWNLCGSLCTINDILVKQFPVGNLNLNDLFIFENTGAYCMTESIALFLSRDLPKVIKLKKNNELELVREDISTYPFNM